jgi:hypothetical protein
MAYATPDSATEVAPGWRTAVRIKGRAADCARLEAAVGGHKRGEQEVYLGLDCQAAGNHSSGPNMTPPALVE